MSRRSHHAELRIREEPDLSSEIGRETLRYAVGLRLTNKSEHVVVDADDALIAALRVKAERPDAMITYVRRQNKRGDARHPADRLVRKTR